MNRGISRFLISTTANIDHFDCVRRRDRHFNLSAGGPIVTKHPSETNAMKYLVLLLTLFASPAFAGVCYHSVLVTPRGTLVCDKTSTNSADFSGKCTTTTQDVYEQQPYICDGKWYPVFNLAWNRHPLYNWPLGRGSVLQQDSASLQTYFCSLVGKKPTTIEGQTCASLRWQPTTGDGWDTLASQVPSIQSTISTQTNYLRSRGYPYYDNYTPQYIGGDTLTIGVNSWGGSMDSQWLVAACGRGYDYLAAAAKYTSPITSVKYGIDSRTQYGRDITGQIKTGDVVMYSSEVTAVACKD